MTQTARTYGESLYALARDEQLSEELLSQLQMVVSILQENPQYATLLSLPSVPKEERCAVLDESFRGQIHPYLLNFLKILTENRTISQLSGCEEAYRRCYNEDQNIAEVVAISAIPLTEENLADLQRRLAERVGKTIQLNTRIDPDILGGICLEMDGTRFDGTVRCRLDDMQATLRDMLL